MGGVDRHEARSLAGRYRLVERLGVGGMSVVWLGYDEVLGRQVAIKLLAPTVAADTAFRHRLRAEAQAAARLCHPNITNVYDYGESSGPGGTTIPYVVMELVDGEPMSARLRSGGAMPWRQAVTACAEVASALAVAHARGVVHRDVTPNNVMLTETGAKMVDFGISAVVGENDVGPDGALLGTPAYLAPERMDPGSHAGTVSPATDVYALGVLLYRSLVGRLPWPAATTTQLLTAHRVAEPEPMPPVRGLPPGVAELCRRCLAKRPEDRPGTAELARALAAAAGIAVTLPGRVDGPRTGPEVEALAAMGTTILPPPGPAGSAGPAGRTPHAIRPGLTGRPGGRRFAGAGRLPDRVRFMASARRRTEAMLVGAGLAVVAGLILAGAARGPADPPGGAAQEPLALGMGPGPVGCTVEYRLERDTGRSFDAAVAVTNTGREPVGDWRLEFAFPGDQKVVRGSGGQWRQSGRDVVVRPADGQRLAPGKPARLAATGDYRDANPLPVIFKLNGTACEAVVSGTSGGTAAGSTTTRTATQAAGAGGPGHPHSGPGGPGGPAGPGGGDEDKPGKDKPGKGDSGKGGPGKGKKGKGGDD